MSSPAFSAPLTLEPRPSPLLGGLLVLLHALAAGALLLVPPTWGAVGGVLLCASGVHEWRRARRPLWLRWRADDAWEHSGSDAPSSLHGSSFLSPWLIVLALDDGRRIRRWVLARDALVPAQWRRLRARLQVAAPVR